MNIDWSTLLEDCIDFTQRLIQTPSMPFEEATIAQLVLAECHKIGLDEAWIDGIGNVHGRLRGTDPTLGALVLNTHLDHVDPGELSLWQQPPYAAHIVDGRIVGRGACDIKGPLAVQLYSLAALVRAGLRPRRDVVFTAVVQEEVGGAGAIYWVQNLDYAVDLLVLGEPTDNKIALGHRGILQMWVTFHGRSVHASVPEKAQNPNYALAAFLQELASAQHQLQAHPVLGPTTVSPTIIEVDTKSGNVTPAWSRVLLDFRTAVESSNSLQAFVHQLIGDWPHTLSDEMNDKNPDGQLPDSDQILYGFYTPPEDPKAIRAQALISQATGREVPFSRYQFATDGRHFVPYNLSMIGYAASEESQAHVVNESISIAKMEESLRGHVQLLHQF